MMVKNNTPNIVELHNGTRKLVIFPWKTEFVPEAYQDATFKLLLASGALVPVGGPEEMPVSVAEPDAGTVRVITVGPAEEPVAEEPVVEEPVEEPKKTTRKK